jgi:integrase
MEKARLSPDYPDKKDPTKYRVNCERAFKTAVKNAGAEDFSPHTMRHTFASWLAIEGVSLYKIKSWLGHSNIKTTETYAHLQPQDEDINRL